MFFKKNYLIAIIVFLALSIFIANSQEIIKVEEIRYQCRVESYNPLWHVLFFLFSSDNQEFLWREKSGLPDYGHFREIEVFNKIRRVIRFFNQGENYEAEISFEGEESNRLNSEQTKVLFKMWDFVRSAKVGEKYKRSFLGNRNFYFIIIEAKEKCSVRISKSDVTVIYFEGKVVKMTDDKSEQFLEIKLWVVASGELAGRIVKCSFKKSFWPTVTVEIIK